MVQNRDDERRSREAGPTPGVEILEDSPGAGAWVERHRRYEVRLRIWLRRGDLVRWGHDVGRARLEDHGTTLVTCVRVDRGQLFAGLLRGLEGMRVGGTRRLRVAPHLAYGAKGVPGVIPAHAVLTVEVQVLAERADE